VRKDLLRFFHLRPRVEGHVRAIARQIEHDPGAVSRELRRLEAQGVVTSTFIGRSRVYRLAQGSPIGKELRTIVQRTLGIEARLRQAVADLPDVRYAAIFGSYAAGTERPTSDIDLLIVGSPPSNELRRRVASAERELRRDINLVELTPEELRDRQAKRDPFVHDVFRGKRIALTEERPKRGR